MDIPCGLLPATLSASCHPTPDSHVLPIIGPVSGGTGFAPLRREGNVATEHQVVFVRQPCEQLGNEGTNDPDQS
ncbi:hypothetical protein BTUL_0074g00380 [Botrytis tulipae]|uniref:Uncharacterized protein n=1 Tax=Botrytis tulipae TaxID=87230 RepID=A0A4Z1EVT0_9HELO|nr:hypothetical protein BTUL_0074g00380 [Botrytis tulipae]